MRIEEKRRIIFIKFISPQKLYKSPVLCVFIYLNLSKVVIDI